MDEARFAAFGPFSAVRRAGGGEGLRAVHASATAVALTLSEARLARELAGRRALEGDPRLPRLLDRDEATLVLEARLDDDIAPAADLPAAALPASRAPFRDTRRALLAALSGRRPGRALRGLGLSARRVDRWLDAVVDGERATGATFGGVRAGWWARGPEGPVALRADRAAADGWPILDAAAAHLDAGEAPPPDGLLGLAIGAILLRDDEPGLADWLGAQLDGPDPETVRVTIEAPSFVRPDQWEPPGATVSAARARWLLRNLDGLAVGGARVRVRVEPSIRKGRGAPPREPRAARQARLFSRWAEGVRVDEEGLFSVTPEALALRFAAGARGRVVDATAGVGGLTIAFARQPGVTEVIAVDRDPERLAMAAHNARIYGVAERVTFVAGDARDVAPRHPDALLAVDPPWGGPGYDRDRVGFADLPMDVPGLLEGHRGEVRLKLPRSFDVAELGPGWTVEAMVDARGILKLLAARRPPR